MPSSPPMPSGSPGRPRRSTRQLAILFLTLACLGSSVQAQETSEAPAPAATPALPGFLSFFGLAASTRISPSVPSADEPLAVQELPAPPSSLRPIDLTEPTDDLWLRLRNGFAMPNLSDELVLKHQQWYQNRPESLRRMVERSRRYMHHIVEELEKRGMPTEIALLPMVESAFNPMALSRAQASGLWQFIPSTGKNYRLEQNWWHDQRRDIIASTSAALDYLQAIYEMHGDWHLALASYNWGEGAVKRAIQKNEAKGLPTDYLSLNMPAETRHYVPKLQALKNIFSSQRLMAELKIPPLTNRPYFATIESSKPMDVKTAARLAAMPVEEFVALNPSHNRPVIKADTPLVIPADKVETFQANLENADAPLSSWQAYTLKPGERLDKLAPRFGISLADLKRLNGLSGKLKISAGSTLLVPNGKGEADLDGLPAHMQPRLPEISEPPAERKQVATKGKEAAGKPGKPALRTELAKAEKSGKSAKGKDTKVAKAGKPEKTEKVAKAAPGKPAAKVAASPASRPAERKAAKEVAKGGDKKKEKSIAAKPARVSARIVKAGVPSLA